VRIVRSLALALIALLVSLALGEGALRLAGFGPAPAGEQGDWGLSDPVLGWTTRPGVGHAYETGRVAMTFWPDGQRASSSTSDKPAKHTVLLMGCSFTAGLGVADDETFAWRLNELYPDVRFENHGVPGYGTYQSLLLLERLLRERRGPPPDLVVYGFIGDHVRRNVAALSWLQQIRSLRALYEVPPHVTLEGDGLAEHPPGLVAAWPFEYRSAWIRVLHDLWLARPKPKKRNVVATNQLIERMNREVEEAGSRFLVAILDDLPSRTEAFLGEGHIPVVDCREPAFHRDAALRVGDHPSARLHAEWSECLRRAFDAKGLLPPPPRGR
jgi:hypothetical protein